MNFKKTKVTSKRSQIKLYVVFGLHEVQNQTKLIYGNRNKNSRSLCGCGKKIGN